MILCKNRFKFIYKYKLTYRSYTAILVIIKKKNNYLFWVGSVQIAAVASANSVAVVLANSVALAPVNSAVMTAANSVP